MTSHEAKQARYALKRAETQTPTIPLTRVRPVRVIGGATMDAPPRIQYLTADEAEVRANLAAAGMEFADETAGKGNFW